MARSVFSDCQQGQSHGRIGSLLVIDCPLQGDDRGVVLLELDEVIGNRHSRLGQQGSRIVDQLWGRFGLVGQDHLQEKRGQSDLPFPPGRTEQSPNKQRHSFLPLRRDDFLVNRSGLLVFLVLLILRRPIHRCRDLLGIGQIGLGRAGIGRRCLRWRCLPRAAWVGAAFAEPALAGGAAGAACPNVRQGNAANRPTTTMHALVMGSPFWRHNSA